MIISLGNRLLDPFSSLPGSRWRAGPTRWAALAAKPPATTHAPCLTLLPAGFTEPNRSPGLLLSSYLTVSPLPRGPQNPRGGLLSVALSLASRPVGVTHHCVLGSPDFPPARSYSEPLAATPFTSGRRSSDRLPSRLTIARKPQAGKGANAQRNGIHFVHRRSRGGTGGTRRLTQTRMATRLKKEHLAVASGKGDESLLVRATW